MTLVVCWRSREEIFCASDTRLSSNGVKLTDTAAKLFNVPYTISRINGSDGVELGNENFNCGFAFAGSAIAAQNTHSAASACARLLTTFGELSPPTLAAIAKLYASVANQVMRELAFLSPATNSRFSGLIFGFCPRTLNPKFFMIECDRDQTPIEFAAKEISIHLNEAFAFGSGAEAFQKVHVSFKAKRSRFSIFDVFEKTLLAQGERSVSDRPQMAVCSRNTFRFETFIMPESDDPASRGVRQYLNGVDLDQIGEVDGYTIGRSALGFGMRSHTGRTALAARGEDWKGAAVSEELQNLASFELMIEYLENPHLEKPVSKVDINYRMSPVTPAFTKWYVVSNCPNCKMTSPICENRTNGRINKPFEGIGHLITTCWHCKNRLIVQANEVWSAQWLQPTS